MNKIQRVSIENYKLNIALNAARDARVLTENWPRKCEMNGASRGKHSETGKISKIGKVQGNRNILSVGEMEENGKAECGSIWPVGRVQCRTKNAHFGSEGQVLVGQKSDFWSDFCQKFIRQIAFALVQSALTDKKWHFREFGDLASNGIIRGPVVGGARRGALISPNGDGSYGDQWRCPGSRLDDAHQRRYINNHIRSDKENQLMLRTRLRDVDIQTIQDVARGRDTYAARVLRSKMATDATYSLKRYQWVEDPASTSQTAKENNEEKN
ncbi:hypothetical protein C8R43DRAFT_1106407 [Mycena crocata]|nr:hypothetical protein C8R43DRAFT_1106407 [Mycena crocata]